VERRGVFERLAVRALTRWNHSALAKRVVWWFVRSVSHTWIHASTRNRLRITGMEAVAALDPPRGVLLVANHRSFWDMYIATSVLTAHTGFAQSFYFPVRSAFFYSNPIGVLVNLLVAGGSMWPAMVRGFDRAGHNAAALEELARILDTPHRLAGIHPEGTRSKTADPMDFVPAKGGAGRLLLACHPDVVVIPLFLTGLSNDLPREIARNFRRPGRRGPAIRLAWGTPIRAGELQATGASAVEVARDLLDRCRRLGAAMAPPPSDPPQV